MKCIGQIACCDHRTERASVWQRSRSATRSGFTLVEVLVAIAIIGLLAALVMPAVMQSRAAADRLACQSNLRQLAMAVGTYEVSWGVYPHGLSFKYDLLPYIEQRAVYLARGPFDPNDPWKPWEPIKAASIPVYQCPSDPETLTFRDAAASYVGCYGSGVFPDGYNGMFNYWIPWNPDQVSFRPIRPADVTDGLSNTAALSEFLVGNNDRNAVLRTIYNTPRSYGVTERDALADFCEAIPEPPLDYGYGGDPFSRGRPWYHGNFGYGQYNHVLPPNRPSCLNQANLATGAMTAASLHAGGVNVAFGDGHVEFESSSTDRTVWRELGSRTARVGVPFP